MRRPPPSATWVPLLALVVLAGLGAYVTAEVPKRPSARLFRSAHAFCAALSAGELERAVEFVAPAERTPANLERLRSVSEARRGTRWSVVRVEGGTGRTVVVWGAAIADTNPRGEVLHWVQRADGAWKLVL